MKIFYLILFLVFLNTTSQAQDHLKLVGESKLLSGELIDNSIRDVNGQVAAGVKIKTDLTGFSVESNNGVIKMNTKSGEYLVFLSPNERVITIRKTGYLPLQIILPEQEIRLKSGQVWEIVVTAENIFSEDLTDLLAIKKQQEFDNKRREDLERQTRANAIEIQSKLLEQEKLKIQKEEDQRKLEEQQKAKAQQRYEQENATLKSAVSSLSLDQTLAKWYDLKQKGDKRQQELEDLQNKAIKIAIDEAPKDEFESQAEYIARLKNNSEKKNVITDEYTILIKTALSPIKEEMSELSKLQFEPNNLKIDLGPYDAEVKKFTNVKVIAEINNEIVKENSLSFKSTTLTYTSSFFEEPAKARLFRQSENMLIHTIYLFVDLDGKQKLNVDITLKEPIEENTVELKLKLDLITENIDMEFILIPTGTFQMGSNDRDREKPIHEVIISEPFYMGKYEVTQKEWKAVMGTNPSYFKGDDLPVENVNWNDIQEFIKKLNYNVGGNNFRLPAEAEWEYASRAGSKTRWQFGDNLFQLNEYAWFDKNSNSKTHDVGLKKPNQFGLFDMHGNVWEWVNDLYGTYNSGKQTDLLGSNFSRVYRGGSFQDNAVGTSSSNRFKEQPDFRYSGLGFRLVRVQ